MMNSMGLKVSGHPADSRKGDGRGFMLIDDHIARPRLNHTLMVLQSRRSVKAPVGGPPIEAFRPSTYPEYKNGPYLSG
jgi:hypothetical protein